MMAASSLISELRGCLVEGSARIARDFAATGDGRAAVAQRTHLIEDILKRLWLDLVSSDEAGPRDFTLVATGGFGGAGYFRILISICFSYMPTAGVRKPIKRRSGGSRKSCGI